MTAAPTRTLRLRLKRDPDKRHRHAGGSVTYRAYLNQRWIGWVGDGRDWRGSRYGALSGGCWLKTATRRPRPQRPDPDHPQRRRRLAAEHRQQGHPRSDSGSSPPATLRAVHASANSRTSASPPHDPGHGTHAGYTGQVAVDPDELLHTLRQLRAEATW